MQAKEVDTRRVKQEREVGVKREAGILHDTEDDDELTLMEERPRKRQHLPSEGDEVIVLD